MTALFTPLSIKDITFKNRIGMSPMCQYSSSDGIASDWHMVHLGARAVGGVGLIMSEATAVSAQGRISAGCAGLWNEQQAEKLEPIVAFQKSYGAVTGTQIGHSGRKGSAQTALKGGNHLSDANGGWQTVSATEQTFDPTGDRLWRQPMALRVRDIIEIQEQFVKSAKLARDVGYDLLEIHGAHGYLLHSFLTPLINNRTDAYGGTPENCARFLIETVEKVRAVWPENKVLAVRLSVDDFVKGGLVTNDIIPLARILKESGVDIIDCSAGGAVPESRSPINRRIDDQPAMAGDIRRAAGIATMAVGGITEPIKANEIVESGSADIVLLGRELMRNPYWPYHAAKTLGHEDKTILAKNYGAFVG